MSESVATDVNSADSIVVDRAELDAVIHELELHSHVLMTWDYERSRTALVKLYEKAKTSQWNATTDLPWATDVDLDRLGPELRTATSRFQTLREVKGSPVAKWGEKEWDRFALEMQRWTMSQFLHGEQGALVCTGLITATVPWIDAKYYAATQVMDEARHVEVFARYIDEKLGGAYPISPQLGGLLDDIVRDGRWDITYLGMQIMVITFMQENGDPAGEVFQQMLFSKIVPNCKKLGLLDAGDGWLRTQFTDLGIIQFEDWVDTSEEYGQLDAVAADRAGAAG